MRVLCVGLHCVLVVTRNVLRKLPACSSASALLSGRSHALARCSVRTSVSLFSP